MSEATADEVRRLRACIRDLTALATLFTVTVNGRSSEQIAGTLIDALRLTLDPDLVGVRLLDRAGRVEAERSWAADGVVPVGVWQAHGIDAGERRVLAAGPRRLVRLPMGIRGDGGVIVVGARRPEFPTDIEMFLLRTAENHATVALQVSRYASELERTNRAKDDFLAVLSHELRTPLTSILGWTKMLRSGQLDEDATRHAAEVIERNARSQAALIDDLLDVSRIVAGKITLDCERAALATIVLDVVESARPAAETKGLTLSVTSDLDAVSLLDVTRMRQAVANLLTNAVKFTPEGGRIDVRLVRDGKFAVVTVADTGVGVAPAALPYIFDWFRQGEGGTTANQGGLGLGLAIVRHLVELHGGAVYAASDGPGRGTTVTIRLPILAAGEARPPVGGAEPATVAGYRLGGTRVLVVDDHADTREVLKTALLTAGAEVLTAGSGVEALDVIATEPPDVLVCDVAMPGMSGYDVIRSLRDAGGARIVAIAVTAHARPEDRARALAAGYDAYVAKPLELEALLELLAGVAGNSAAA